jgi:hypothetical protein
LDFNPFGEVTDSLLFDWNELNEPNDTVLRHVDHESQFSTNPYAVYGVPTDVIDIVHDANTDKLVDLIKQVIQAVPCFEDRILSTFTSRLV